MWRWIEAYVRAVEWLNYRLGRVMMYFLFVMMGILLWSSISKVLVIPSIWTLEMAQFSLVAYYMLGGPYSLQLGSNVRMDLLYSGWSERKRTLVDTFSIFAMIFYLGVLLYGGITSTIYALEYGERSYSSWRPYMAPIKIVMDVGLFLMLLQSFAIFFKDLCKLMGRPIRSGIPCEEALGDVL